MWILSGKELNEKKILITAHTHTVQKPLLDCLAMKISCYPLESYKCTHTQRQARNQNAVYFNEVIKMLYGNDKLVAAFIVHCVFDSVLISGLREWKKQQQVGKKIITIHLQQKSRMKTKHHCCCYHWRNKVNRKKLILSRTQKHTIKSALLSHNWDVSEKCSECEMNMMSMTLHLFGIAVMSLLMIDNWSVLIRGFFFSH